jgi:hypothetical protein
MYTLHCTRSLLAKLKEENDHARGMVATTRLGDWYANRVNIGHSRLILCTNERTLLSVVIPAKDLPSLPQRVAASVAQLLLALDIDQELVKAEADEMNRVSFAPTANRSVLGSMNDFQFQIRVELEAGEVDLLAINLRLSDVPCGPLGYDRPADRALQELSGGGRR